MKRLLSFVVLMVILLLILMSFSSCKTTITEYETDPAKLYINEEGKLTQPVLKEITTYDSQIQKTYAVKIVGFGLRIKFAPRDITAPIDIWLGYIGTEKASAIKGKKAEINKTYDNISLLKPSGNIKTNLIVGEDIKEKKPNKTPTKPKNLQSSEREVAVTHIEPG